MISGAGPHLLMFSDSMVTTFVTDLLMGINIFMHFSFDWLTVLRTRLLTKDDFTNSDLSDRGY